LPPPQGQCWPAGLAAWYIHSVNWEYWSKALRETERELDAATTRTAVNAATKKVMRAKAELKQLEGKAAG
jgi:hypothetical protein